MHVTAPNPHNFFSTLRSPIIKYGIDKLTVTVANWIKHEKEEDELIMVEKPANTHGMIWQLSSFLSVAR
jgi:hypothetical protein